MNGTATRHGRHEVPLLHWQTRKARHWKQSEAMFQSSLELLAEVVQTLADAQVKTWLFGGWAEELLELCPPRPHRDIDLLYPAQSFDRLDEFLRAQRGAKEVEAKRFPHKRAFEWAGVLVEVFLVRSDADVLVTDFFGTFSFEWPQDTLSYTAKLTSGDWPCASPAAQRLYRARHGEVEAARQAFLR